MKVTRLFWAGFFGLFFLGFFLGGASPCYSANPNPTQIADEFFRLLQSRDFAGAAEYLSASDHQKFQDLKHEVPAKNAPQVDLVAALTDMFFLLQGQENKVMVEKAKSGDVILPERIRFFIPGQFYLQGQYAVVFTREMYDIRAQDTGAVRDDPRKLWIDPTNFLSRLRDEPWFKQYWEWTDNQLTMPGLIWLVKENNQWKIDLFSGGVPKTAFRKTLKWHFRRDVFEEVKAPSPAKYQSAK
jgi:hypothetical protein